MRTRTSIIGGLSLVGLFVPASAHRDGQGPAPPQPLAFVRAIELPRVEGRIDHLALNAAGDRLFIAALENDSVEVVDVKSASHLRSLPGFHEPQGIGGAADRSLIAVANGAGEGAQLIDANDYHVVRAVKLGDDSDNVRYDAAAKRLYVGHGAGARTGLFSQQQRRFYLAVPHRGGQRAEIRVFEARE